MEHLPVFKALREYNPEKLLVFRAPSGNNPQVKHLPHVDNPQVQSGTNNSSFLGLPMLVHESKEQLLIFKAPSKDDPRVEQLPCMDDPGVQSRIADLNILEVRYVQQKIWIGTIIG